MFDISYPIPANPELVRRYFASWGENVSGIGRVIAGASDADPYTALYMLARLLREDCVAGWPRARAFNRERGYGP